MSHLASSEEELIRRLDEVLTGSKYAHDKSAARLVAIGLLREIEHKIGNNYIPYIELYSQVCARYDPNSPAIITALSELYSYLQKDISASDRGIVKLLLTALGNNMKLSPYEAEFIVEWALEADIDILVISECFARVAPELRCAGITVALR